jgi:hypothetical protein
MGVLRTVESRSWQDFKRDLLPELFGVEAIFRSGVFLFRGVSNADWSLSSSFDRRFASLDRDQRLFISEQLVSRFRAAVAGTGIVRLVDDERQILALGQHYGLPTRLIDWTLSPYVASFFAFRHAAFEGHGATRVAIWALDTRSAVWTEEMGVEILAPPTYDNIRLRNQSGRFTLSRTPASTLEEHVQRLPGKEISLWKFVLPTWEAVAALADLDAMGVNPQYLFPDLTGLAEHVTLSVSCEMLASEHRWQ